MSENEIYKTIFIGESGVGKSSLIARISPRDIKFNSGIFPSTNYQMLRNNVKIPGFKAGTYQVGIPGREYVTLECKGTPTQIENVKSETKNGTTIYDLQGRKMTNDVRKGITIKNGKKTLHR